MGRFLDQILAQADDVFRLLVQRWLEVSHRKLCGIGNYNCTLIVDTIVDRVVSHEHRVARFCLWYYGGHYWDLFRVVHLARPLDQRTSVVPYPDFNIYKTCVCLIVTLILKTQRARKTRKKIVVVHGCMFTLLTMVAALLGALGISHQLTPNSLTTKTHCVTFFADITPPCVVDPRKKLPPTIYTSLLADGTYQLAMCHYE